jgi:hypothetical protein
MKNATLHSEQTSDESAQGTSSPDAVSDADFLAREIEDAKAALSSSLADLRSSAAASVDLSAWARAYPWPTVAASAAAGFAVAALVMSKSKKSDVPAESGGDTADVSPHAAGKNATAGRSFLRSICFAAFDLAKLLIETLLVTAVRSAQSPAPPASSTDDRDGRDAAAS